jgi:branched-chain amino acid transport system permease protein
MMRSNRLRDAAFALVLLIVLLALPAIFPQPGLRDFLIYVIAYGLLAMSLNLLIGLTGLVAFGHAAFFASGAYVFGILMQTGRVGIPLAILAAVGGTALLALVVGVICVRLKDIYFSFITLAIQMFLHSVILTWVSLTGGDQGLQGGIPRPAFLGIDLNNAQALYAFCVVLFIVCIVIMRQVSESPFGYTLRLIRDNPARADFLGVNVVRMKLGVFVLAGTMASVGGIVLALFVSGAYPDFAFWTTSGEAIFMLILGGTQLFLGPLAGALLLQTLNHYISSYTEYHGLVLGVIILAIVLGLRQGIADSLFAAILRRRHARRPVSASPALNPPGHEAV